MKIEVGKSYITKNLEIVSIVESKEQILKDASRVVLFRDKNYRTWDVNGVFYFQDEKGQFCKTQADDSIFSIVEADDNNIILKDDSSILLQDIDKKNTIYLINKKYVRHIEYNSDTMRMTIFADREFSLIVSELKAKTIIRLLSF